MMQKKAARLIFNWGTIFSESLARHIQLAQDSVNLLRVSASRPQSATRWDSRRLFAGDSNLRPASFAQSQLRFYLGVWQMQRMGSPEASQLEDLFDNKKKPVKNPLVPIGASLLPILFNFCHVLFIWSIHCRDLSDVQCCCEHITWTLFNYIWDNLTLVTGLRK
jgi:hypothetical protein